MAQVQPPEYANTYPIALAGPIGNRKSQFVFWFRISGFIYLVLIVVIVLLGIYLPEYLGPLLSDMSAVQGAG